MVRCKFVCTSKCESRGWHQGDGNVPLYAYTFEVVTGTGASVENKLFFAATPSGTLRMTTVLDDRFVVGQAYYLTLVAE